jgi:hypothetical protein
MLQLEAGEPFFGETMVVELSLQWSRGRSILPSTGLRPIPYSHDPETGEVNLLAGYIARFGSLISGTKIFGRIFYIQPSNGQRSPALEFTALVS